MLTLLILPFFFACSDDLEEFNKPALYWYNKMVDSIANGELDKADHYYSSLQSEHISSPLLPDATMIMAQAHMYQEEYLLSEHFLNEYIQRFANDNEREYAEFLKVKAKYLAISHPRRDQGLIDETIVVANKFKQHFKQSQFYFLVNAIDTRLILARYNLNDNIAELYERLDKPKGATYYYSLNSEKWIDKKRTKPASIPMYREVFEGDGTSSWYDFLIPDTQSVVSRNSINDEDE